MTFKKIITILFFLFFFQSCSSLRKGIGIDKDIPDEFLVKKIDPLKKPPNYDLLPPDSVVNEKNKKGKEKSLKEIISQSTEKNTSDNLSNLKERKQNSGVENDILNQIKK